MTDSEPSNSPGGATPGTRPKGKKRRGRRSPDQPFTINFPHVAMLHQARVMAMQSLYESDLTDHELDDILQHVGVPKRTELTAWFRDIRSAAFRAVESIEGLARAVDREELARQGRVGEELTQFSAASRAALDEVAAAKDAPDGEPVDPWLASVQKQVTGRIRRILSRHRDGIEAVVPMLDDLEQGETTLEPFHQLQESGNPARTPPPTTNGPGALGRVSAGAKRDLDAFLDLAEQQSLDHLLEMLRHADRLARGVVLRQPELDPIIERAAPAFPMPQLASVDRVVLRLAVYELLHEPKVPLKVAINEAVEIAKNYGGPNSGKFVNGVLRTIAESMPSDRTNTP